MEINIRSKDVAPADGQRFPDTFLVGPPFASIFAGVKMKLNGKVVSDSENYNLWIVQHLLMTKTPKHVREALRNTAMMYDRDISVVAALKGSDGKEKINFKAGSFKDIDSRLEMFNASYKFPVVLSWYLMTDVSWGGRVPLVLPAGVSMELEFIPAPPARVIIKEQPEGLPSNPYVEISKISLTLPRVIPTTSSPKRSLTHQFLKLSPHAFVVPKGSTLYLAALSYASTPLPVRLTLRFISMSAFDGSYRENVNASRHMGVTSVTYSMAGRSYPANSLPNDFQSENISPMLLSTSEALRYSLEVSGAKICNRQEYQNGGFLNSVDLSPDMSADATWSTPKEKGNITMRLTFQRPTDAQCLCLVISETLSDLVISRDGVVDVQ